MGVERHGIADCRALRHLDQLFDELIVDRPLQQKPRAGDAGLAGGGEDAGNRAHYSGLEVRVLEYDVGRFAAQFQCHVLERTCRRLVDLLPGVVRTGKGDLGDVLVLDDGRPDIRSKTGHGVDDTVRKSGFFNEFP